MPVDRIRFYMDEHVPRAVTLGLRRRGVDVVTAQDMAMLGVDDAVHLDWATKNGRVTFTQDTDFLTLHALGVEHAGIVYVPQQTAVGYMVRGLLLIVDVLTPEEMRSKVEYL